MNMGQRIRALRAAHNLSRPQLALKLDDMSPSTLKGYELGLRAPSAAMVAAIATHCGGDWALYVLGVAPAPATANQ